MWCLKSKDWARNVIHPPSHMRLQLFDVFTKPAEDARIRTSSGGAVTLGAFVLLAWLLIAQIRQYFSVSWVHQLQVDDSVDDKMNIVFDITFPNLPCELLNIDSVDENGEVQQNLHASLEKTDLDEYGKTLDPSIKQRQRDQQESAIAARGPDYRGGCFGAEEGLRRSLGLGPDDEVFCRTCEDVHKAYVTLNWAFHDGHGFDQCVEEGYSAAIHENKNNGCRVSGHVTVGKVVGRLHMAPGESFFSADRHSHDLSSYDMEGMPYDFSHTITHFSFTGVDQETSPSTEHSLQTLQEDPLAGYTRLTDEKDFQFRYFLHIVGTDYTFRSGKTIETNQYSATHHERPLKGGRDGDHPHSLHNRGGIPGLWFNFDISPMRVKEIEKRSISIAELLMNVFAIIGAVITTAAVVDKGVYAVDQALKSRKER